MANWKLKIDFTSIDWSGDGDWEKNRECIVKILKKNLSKVHKLFGEDARWELSDIIDEIEVVDGVEDLDVWLDELFDFGDEYFIWFEK